MNKQIDDFEIKFDVDDVRCVARAANHQLVAVPTKLYQSVSNLLITDTFSLGYVFGFAEQASRHSNGSSQNEVSRNYIENVFANLLENPKTAHSFVLFVHYQRNDRVFEAGYLRGLTDLNNWVLSRGTNLPFGLVDFIT